MKGTLVDLWIFNWAQTPESFKLSDWAEDRGMGRDNDRNGCAASKSNAKAFV
jgi:hypothetical protein